MSSLVGWHNALLLLCLLASNVLVSLGDGSDWVSVAYVVQEARQIDSSSGSMTVQALDSIVRGADQLLAKGPWSVTNDKSILPPNEDPHDYMSWAPYHWPDCKWCTTPTRAKTKDVVDDDGPAPDQGPARESKVPPAENDSVQLALAAAARRRSYRPRRAAHRRRMRKARRHPKEKRDEATAAGSGTTKSSAKNKATGTTTGTKGESTPLTVAPVPTTNNEGLSATVTQSATRAPAGAVAKNAKTTCTPSPTTSLAPGATWTSCPYIGRDGKVNPDVRTLNGPGAINSVGQLALYGSIAFGTRRNVKYSQAVVKAIDAFFLDPETKMNPNVNFGQMVRGPGPEHQNGTFTGILDIRGLVKVINGIFILKSGGSSEWSSAKEQDMRGWVQEYTTWLEESQIGGITASRPNNHVTFYVAQLAASKYYIGDRQGAIAVLQHFFKNEFRDQIAASGEQPFEGIRAKPVHYRAFNLEALIMNAKLGDALGQDFWTVKSKYGATIQTALDYAIVGDSKAEDMDDLVPHVAAVAAAYGDPQGKYKTFLEEKLSGYQKKPFWFYDQPSALVKAPTSRKVQGLSVVKGEDELGDGDDEPNDPGVHGPVSAKPNIPFTCPEAFKNTAKVEIDNDIYVTCEQLRPLYETDASVPGGVVNT